MFAVMGEGEKGWLLALEDLASQGSPGGLLFTGHFWAQGSHESSWGFFPPDINVS